MLDSPIPIKWLILMYVALILGIVIFFTDSSKGAFNGMFDSPKSLSVRTHSMDSFTDDD